jgi:hypothetical protein
MGSGRVLASALSVSSSITVQALNMGGRGCGFPRGATPQFGYGFVVLDFAYGDPGERITAGEGIPGGREDDQDISDDQGPGEGSLGGLALGAVGLLAWRKSRSRTARLEGA